MSKNILLLVSHQDKANRLINALKPDGYQFTIVMIDDFPRDRLDRNYDLVILWFPYSSPEALQEFDILISLVREFNPQKPIPVLLIIDQYGVHWVEPGFKLGITDILTRPIHPLVLRRRVELILKAREMEDAVRSYLATMQSLQDERQRLFNVLDFLPIYVFLRNPDYSIHFANRTFRRLFGEPGNQKCFNILRKRETPCEECHSLDYPDKRIEEPFEWQTTENHVYQTYLGLLKEEDNLERTLEIGVDITEISRFQSVLEEERERFRTVADFTYDWEYWMDENGQVLYNSPSCERITGMNAQDFEINPALLQEIIHPDDRNDVLGHFRKERTVESLSPIDFRILTKDGRESWIGHVCQPVYDQTGNHAGRRISNRDITDRKNAEKLALQSNRLAAIGQLLASLAHEINNPLQAMYSNLELALDYPISLEEKQQCLETVRKQTNRLMNISESILDFSRPRTANPQSTEISPLLQGVVSLLSNQIQNTKISVEQKNLEYLPRVKIPSDELEQVFLNLMINAIEHMPDGGKLEIQAGIKNNQVEMCFKDTGTGIPTRHLKWIFDPLFTTKPNGTGLGLSTTQRILQEYQGGISVSSEEGEGSSFFINLPVCLDELEDRKKFYEPSR